MEKDNKYYTPAIEEFHVGFEYEHYTKDWVYEKDKKEYKHTWVKVKFNQDEDLGVHLSDIEYFIETEQVRVKYLDKEDIESLKYKDLGSLWFENKKDKTRIRKWIGTQVDIYTDWCSHEDHALRFRGSCKNKSELKKLMKQLNIIE